MTYLNMSKDVRSFAERWDFGSRMRGGVPPVPGCTPQGHARGHWNDALFAEYRALQPGAKKRSLASELIRINEPLVIILVEQVCGRANPKPGGRRTAASSLRGRCTGFSDIPFEDAMQAGRMALAKALDQFNPEKGKISYYLLNKIIYELQLIERWGQHLARVPAGREHERAGISLVGEQGELDRAAGAESLGGLVESDEITPEDVARWQETGEWPETLEEAIALRPPPPPPPARPALEVFVEGLVFRRAARVAWCSLRGAWEAFALQRGAFLDSRPLRRELVIRDVKPAKVWTAWGCYRGFDGVKLA